MKNTNLNIVDNDQAGIALAQSYYDYFDDLYANNALLTENISEQGHNIVENILQLLQCDKTRKTAEVILEKTIDIIHMQKLSKMSEAHA